jgi:succinoglycan biosynthesis transport protein ExoP
MNETTDAISIFAPLWRRKWLILAVGIVVAAASYFYYKRERPVYQSVTQVYLGAGAEEQAPSEKASAKNQGTLVSNQVAIINSIVIEGVRRQLRKENRIAIARGSQVRAKAPEKSEFIAITAEAHKAKSAALLANLTAKAYIRRQRSLHRRVIEEAIAISRRQLRRIEAASAPKAAPNPTSSSSKSAAEQGKSGVASTPSTANILQAANLNSKINQLEASLSVTGAQQIKPAKAATAKQLSPKPRKNAIFGFVIGILLASIAAYAMGRLDRRLRTLAGVERVFPWQILTGFPKVGRPVVRRDGQSSPSRFLIEPLRRLHTAFQLAAGPEPERTGLGRVIVFTSADAGDGKSTLVADLALVQRDSGVRVAVVEANFRRPIQARLLGLDGAHGLAEVLAGTLPVEEAMQRVMPTHSSSNPGSATSVAGVATVVGTSAAGSLFLLAGGGAVPNPPALLADGAMTNLLRSLAEDYDYVLIDAPSPLEVSDVMPLLGMVDGIVVVARLGHTREASAQRLVQVLAQASPAPVLGSAANCVPRAEAERYGFSAPRGWGRPGRLIGR